MKKEKLYNVIIPTRERADTLIHSLKTAVLQKYDNLKIIVSDNYSQDNTRDVVASFSDKRIKYINTGKRVSMSRNWEFALSHVNDGYVFFMGDDDGLVPGAVKKVDELLSEYAVEAIVWKKANYGWPSCIHKEAQNAFCTTLNRGVEVRNSKQMLYKIRTFDSNSEDLSYEHLPCLYNSFVSKSAIDKARNRAGFFFCSSVPDIYSAIALTSSVENYIYSFGPLSINGASGHSNGTSYFTNSNLKAAAQFLSEENIPFHADLLLAPSIPLLVAESIWQVRDNVKNCEHYDVDLEKLFSEARRLSATLPVESLELVNASLNKLFIARGLKTHPANVDDDASTQSKIATNCDSNPSKIQIKFLQFKKYNLSYERIFKINEVSNVYDAALFCKKLETRRRLIILYRAICLLRKKLTATFLNASY